MRDDFSKRVADSLAKRVGNRCSNPDCRKRTSGPHTQDDRAVNIGVAAYITAAAPGGPRYDVARTPAERKAAANGIWLCQSCAKLIDNDAGKFTAELLLQWKSQAEEEARKGVASSIGDSRVSDRDALLECRAWFDRPALQDSLRGCGNYGGFVAALDDLISLLNTGSVRGKEVTKRRNEFESEQWRESLEQVYHDLRELREFYRTMVSEARIDETQCRCKYGQISMRIDDKKVMLIYNLNQLLQRAGIKPIRSSGGAANAHSVT
jgi:hypothetical protein